MELQVSQQAPLAQRGQQLSKKQTIIMHLAKLSIRRQAKLDKEDFQVLAEDLMQFELQDIEPGLDKLGLTKRNPGETAFPDAGTLVGTVGRIAYMRISAETRKREAELWEEHKALCIHASADRKDSDHARSN